MARRIGLVVHPTGSDAASLSRLQSSVDRFNADRLPIVVAEPATPQVLDLWRSTDFDIVVSLSSTVEFIRTFSAADFVSAAGVPYTIVSEEAERRVEEVDDALDQARRGVLREVGLDDPRLLVSRGLAVISTRVLRSLSTDFLDARGWDYSDALNVCGDEYAWYTAWLRATDIVPFEMHEPLLAALDTRGARSSLALSGTTAADLARGYLGVLWPPVASADVPRTAADVLAAGLTSGELGSAAVRRVTRKAPRVQRWLRLS